MLPNFLIIGAPRSGTTHLYKGLRQHPEIFMSDYKEPQFFAFEGHPRPGALTERSAYVALFDGAGSAKAVGEASTLYLWSEQAPTGIHESIPTAKLIAILRHPAERAFSQYTFQRFLKTEPLETFEAALAAESQRRAEGVTPFMLYREVGLYGEQVPRYQGRFSAEQLLFLLQDDLESNPDWVFRQIFSFLGVDPEFAPDLRHKTNASGVPQNQTMFEAVKKAGRAVKRFLPETLATRLSGTAHETLLQRPAMNEETRATLIAYFRDDVLRTQDLIGRDLSAWLQ